MTEKNSEEMEKTEVWPGDPPFPSDSWALGASIGHVVPLDGARVAAAQTVYAPMRTSRLVSLSQARSKAS
jgi:hypothetical protein